MKKEKLVPRNIIWWAVGLLGLTFAISMVIKAKLGVGSFESITVGLENWVKNDFDLNISVGVFIIIFNIIFTIVACLIATRKVNILSPAIGILTIGPLVDMWVNIQKNITLSGTPIQIVYLIGGITLIAVFAVVMIQAELALSPLDTLRSELAHRKQISFGLAVWIIEIFLISLGIIIALISRNWMAISIVTFTLGAIVGFLINLFKKPLDKVYKKVVKL